MPPKVLVIGGGFAGMQLAITLAEAGADTTLVSRTDYFEVAFANARCLVEPSLADQVLMPYSALKPHGKFVLGEVVALGDSAATLAHGRTLAFDFCAVASGSDYAVGKAGGGCSTLQQRKAELLALSERVAAASSVVIAGGGPLGVELAGEILTDQPGKRVTLVHAGPRLLPTLPPRLGAAAAAWLTQHGCQVILNDRLELPPAAAAADAGSGGGGGFSGVTAAGVRVAGDVLLVATGIKTNSSFMWPQLADAVDEQGRIMVDSHLRVVGHPNLFALGDVTNVREEKLAFLATKQADLVAESLKALLAAAAAAEAGGGQARPVQLATYKPSAGLPVIMVTIGRSWGVGRIACLTFVGWLPTLVKSRNVMGFVNKYRKQLLRQPA